MGMMFFLDPGLNVESNEQTVNLRLKPMIPLTREQSWYFKNVHSGTLIDTHSSMKTREAYLKTSYVFTSPPVISKSEFIPSQMVTQLMRNKKDTAIGVKYLSGDLITNMEGALHTFCDSSLFDSYVGRLCLEKWPFN